MYCIRHIQNSGIFGTLFFRYMPSYSIIFSVIKAFENCILNIIKAYSGLFRHIQHLVTLAYSWPCHILSPSIFRTRGLFKTLWNVDQTYSEPCHRELFSHIQTFRNLRKACIRRNLAYSESWNIQNPSITASRRIFRTVLYERKFTNIQKSNIFKTRHIFRTSQRFKIEFFCKNS